MSERRVAEVMRQSNGFTKLFVEIQAFAYGARYLGNLNAVGKAGSIIFSFVICKNLSFAVQSAKGGRMNQRSRSRWKGERMTLVKSGYSRPRLCSGLEA